MHSALYQLSVFPVASVEDQLHTCNFNCNKGRTKESLFLKQLPIMHLLYSVWNLQGEKFVFAMLMLYIA